MFELALDLKTGPSYSISFSLPNLVLSNMAKELITTSFRRPSSSSFLIREVRETPVLSKFTTLWLNDVRPPFPNPLILKMDSRPLKDTTTPHQATFQFRPLRRVDLTAHPSPSSPFTEQMSAG